MNRLVHPQYKLSPHILVAFTYILYLIVFAIYHDYAQVGISSLLIVPVIVASWYFGVVGGIVMAMISILATVVIQIVAGRAEEVFVTSNYLRMFTVILVAVIIGKFGSTTRERREALERLESLHEITRTTLEASDLQSTLKGLVERIAKLFQADDALFALWDEENKITTPSIAYGSMSEIYPRLDFEPGERTLAAAVMERGRPLPIPDLKSFPNISPKLASIIPSRSVLGIPLIVQGNKIAVFYLGYNKSRQFDQDEIDYAESVAQQIALVLTKIRLLEESQKQVRQLTVLHEVALVSTQVETIDRLIEHVIEIIGKSLFPDNLGILLMDEAQEVLHPHPSYRFVSAADLIPSDVPLGKGITGQVAKTGQPVRIGNIKDVQNYVEMDQSTSSELCVPIKIKDRVLGVINAESTRPNAFSLDDELLLGTLAGQLATAMEQLRTAEAERRWLDQLAHSNELIYALAHITTHIEKALSKEEIIRVLGEELNKIGLTCLTAVHDEVQRMFTLNFAPVGPKILARIEDEMGFPLIRYSIAPDTLNSILISDGPRQPVVITNPENEFHLLFTRRPKAGILEVLQQIGITSKTESLRLPLLFEEKLLGVLWVWGKGITKADLPIMSIFAKQIGISLERARLFEEVQILAVTDPLTGLLNRRSLFELGRIELARSYRTNRPFCCMMLDVDHFKQINDNYGHPIGDQVLREFAHHSKRSVREVDLIGRYGGEELVIFLPETDSDTALQVAERVRATIAKTPIRILEQELHVTVSIGVSRKDENTLELETLIARADQAMYIAKYKGRNQVAISK